MVLYVLYESASGYALFERIESEEIADESPELQRSIQDFGRFSRIVKFKSFVPFVSAESALENVNAISEGLVHDVLKNFLELNLPGGGKKKSKKVELGVTDEKLGGAINDSLEHVACVKSKAVAELTRGIRLHFAKFIKEFKEGDYEKAQLGLGHSYSRSKVKFNVNRADNMIIQTINLLDTLNKDLNTFSMRCKEWYSWHFPELVKVVPDNFQFARVVKFLKNKAEADESKIPGLVDITQDEAKAKEIIDAAKASMGTDISDLDMLNIEKFADRVIHLSTYQQQLQEYLSKKMHVIAPNLSELVGEHVGARLISHAGSLTNLAKYPASTVQILGAEKALFRALKTRGNTPKYGLIFHSSFIGRAAAKNKGRISRYLANKCSIASRIDAFSDVPTTKFGQKLNAQVEERLKFYDTGALPRKNVDVMKEALTEALTEAEQKQREDGMDVVSTSTSAESTDKKRKRKAAEEDDSDDEEESKKDKKKSKKAKKSKKEEKKSKKEKKDKKDKKKKKAKH
jgi:nucleolar protein 56